MGQVTPDVPWEGKTWNSFLAPAASSGKQPLLGDRSEKYQMLLSILLTNTGCSGPPLSPALLLPIFLNSWMISKLLPLLKTHINMHFWSEVSRKHRLLGTLGVTLCTYLSMQSKKTVLCFLSAINLFGILRCASILDEVCFSPAGLAGDHGCHQRDCESRCPNGCSPLSDLSPLGTGRDDWCFLWEGFSTGSVSMGLSPYCKYKYRNHWYLWRSPSLLDTEGDVQHGMGALEEWEGEDQEKNWE